MANEKHEVNRLELTGVKQCCDYFAQCIKPAGSGRIGLEYEIILMDTLLNKQISYWGLNGLREVFLELMKAGYQAVVENGLIIGLARGDVKVSLEPGGQLEFSGAPVFRGIDIFEELSDFLSLLQSICSRFNISILCVGCNPSEAAEQIEIIPRLRYEVIMPLLVEESALSVNQTITASMQISLDYFSEVHAGNCLALGIRVQPFVVALCANSPMVRGMLTGWKSSRSAMWRNFSSSRSGIPHFMLGQQFSEDTFGAYTRWALEKEILYVVRNGVVIKMPGVRFSDYLRSGYDGMRANVDDWILHLSSVYPEARLKNVVELRSADTCSTDYAAALGVFWKGLFYSDVASDHASKLVRFVDASTVDQLYLDAAKYGLAAVTSDHYKFVDILKELVEVSRYGLLNLECEKNEISLLDVFSVAIKERRSPADYFDSQCN